MARNTLILTAGTLVQTVIALVTVPLYLSRLGEERFGVWVIAGLVISYFGLLDRGLGTAAQNELSKLGDEPREQARIVWTAAILNVVVGVVAAAGVILVGEIVFARVVDIPASLVFESKVALPVLASTVPFVTVMAIFQAALMARGHIVTVSILETLRLLALQLLPLGFIYWKSPDLRWLGLGVVAALALSMAAYVSACIAIVLRQQMWSRPSRTVAIGLFHYGKWVTATSVLTPLLDYSDRVVIGAVPGASAVTAYSIPYNLAARLTIIPLNVMRVVFPRFSAAQAGEAKLMATSALEAITAVTLPAAVIGSILCGPFFDWWLGGDIAHEAAPIGAVLFAGFWINGLGYVPYTLLQAQGRPDVPARYHALEIVPFLAVLALGVYFFGPLGGALAWTFRALTDALLLMRASSLGIGHRRLSLAAAGVVAAAAAWGAHFAFAPVTLAVVGVPLIVASFACALMVAPAEVRIRVRGFLHAPRLRSDGPKREAEALEDET